MSREVMQQALEALESEHPDIQLRAATARRAFLGDLGAGALHRPGAIRQRLIELGWTPPGGDGEQAGSVCARCGGWSTTRRCPSLIGKERRMK